MTEYIRSCIERYTFTSMSGNMILLLGSVIDENEANTGPMHKPDGYFALDRSDGRRKPSSQVDAILSS